MKIYEDEILIEDTKTGYKRNRRGQYRKHSFKDTLRTIARRSLFFAAIVNTAFVLAVLHPIYMPILDASLEVENVVEAAEVDTPTIVEKVFDDAAIKKQALVDVYAEQEALFDEIEETNQRNKERMDAMTTKAEAALDDYNQALFNIGTI